MFDSRLTRWISQSVHKAFDSLSVQVLFENQPKTRSKYSESIEVRIHGPNYRQVNGGWKIQVFVNVLVTVRQENDIYAMEKILGPVTNILATSIVVQQYGVGESEDVVGCLRPAGRVETANQGIFKTETKALQATVENVFYMDIKE